MKKLIIHVFILMVTLTVTGADVLAGNTNKKSKTIDDFETTKALIENGEFVFKARRANPQGMKTIQLNTPYSMEVKSDTASADLPFFGRTYQADYGGDGGIKFSGPMEAKDIKIDEKKGKIIMRFTVKESGENYKCVLNVTKTGSTSLSITSVKKSTISYSGEVLALQ